MLKSFDGRGGDRNDIAYVPRNATRRHPGPSGEVCVVFRSESKYLLVEACDGDFRYDYSATTVPYSISDV